MTLIIHPCEYGVLRPCILYLEISSAKAYYVDLSRAYSIDFYILRPPRTARILTFIHVCSHLSLSPNRATSNAMLAFLTFSSHHWPQSTYGGRRNETRDENTALWRGEERRGWDRFDQPEVWPGSQRPEECEVR